MRKIYSILTILLVAFLFSGCGTKRQYFEPENVDNQKISVEKLSSGISTISRHGTVLKDDTAIVKSGILNIKIPSEATLLNLSNNRFIISTLDGNLKIINSANEILFQKDFEEAIVSASLDDDRLALVSASNIIYLINILTNETMLKFESSNIYSQDSRSASPYFMSSLVIFPTLDGKIMIVDKNQGRIIRDVVVSSEEFFNNIIFLDVINDTMIAATGKRIVSISPDKTVYYAGEIKDLVIHKDNLYILEKDGTIILSDINLMRLNSINFKFAIFSNALAFNSSLYVMEKTGYLIKTDLDLSNAKVYELNDEIETKTFVGEKEFYYDNYLIKLQ